MSSNTTTAGEGGPGFGLGFGPGFEPGSAPDLDTSTLSTNVIVAWSIMMSFAAVTVGLRFYTRRLIIHVLGIEDWLILAAMILAVGACVGFIRQTFSALGHHIWTVAPEAMTKWGMEQWYSFLFYTMSLACTKMSILFLYLRIMPFGLIRIANQVVMAIVMICNIWVFVGFFVNCIPLAKTWDPSVAGSCLPMLSVTLGNSILHVITDFAIFVLPIPILVKLKINYKKKVGLVLVFSLGLFVCLVSMIRLISLTRLDYSDVTYTVSTIAYWGAVEVNLAIICACLTTLKPLLVHLFPRALGTTDVTPYTLGSSMRPKAGAVNVQRTTVVQAEEGSFTRLDDESVKSTNALSPAATYEMESHAKYAATYTVHVAAPSKAHEKLGLS
ncbi:hypothetical protein B0T16DRAFT_335240 [Cercophora newfieldiana]|uniref:Rhodopsin domain-containing protein n=1 Tax=Cercophora newfieldiana TaxID=92897 RepID=A0AA39XXG1_9PEZI|nr:hypothetical protein B0T16DRAFT_335240 [Cercophora newfieldiana]